MKWWLNIYWNIRLFNGWILSIYPFDWLSYNGIIKDGNNIVITAGPITLSKYKEA